MHRGKPIGAPPRLWGESLHYRLCKKKSKKKKKKKSFKKSASLDLINAGLLRSDGDAMFPRP